MERRLGHIMDLQLVEAYLKLDTDQLSSRKIAAQFNKVSNVFRMLLTIGESFCESKSFGFGCPMARLYTICFDYHFFDIYFIATYVQKRDSASPSQRIEDGRQYLQTRPHLLYFQSR